ncbi:MAG: response regulator transcription factor [Spirochaetes bacterium]|nr:response regulator transcription factor [Spirochaetota bacterium]
MNSALRLAIVEDVPETREGLRYLLGLDREIKVVGAFEKAETFLKSLAEGVSLDVVLMDIKLPGMSGIEAAKLVREKYPQIQVIMLTVFEEEKKLIDSVLAGAVGYVLKNTKPEILVEQIKSIHSGGAPLSPKIARIMLEKYRTHAGIASQNTYNLTRREKEILKGIVEGLTYKEIAERSGIACSTVKKHILNVYRKLHVHSKVEFVKKVIQEKLV